MNIDRLFKKKIWKKLLILLYKSLKIQQLRTLFKYDVGETVQEIEEVDEVAESIAKLKAMAGVGSKARSNHGIHEGEEGYQLTPRSIVARQMRKLQDIQNKNKGT